MFKMDLKVSGVYVAQTVHKTFSLILPKENLFALIFYDYFLHIIFSLCFKLFVWKTFEVVLCTALNALMKELI